MKKHWRVVLQARVVMAAESEAASDSVRSFDNSSGQSSDLLDEDSTLGPPPLPSAEADRWGGLPAPWEPLPDWVMALPDSSAPAGESIDVVDNGLAAFGTPHRGLPLARAEEGRMLDDPVPSAVPAVKTETAKPIAPDLGSTGSTGLCNASTPFGSGAPAAAFLSF